MELTLTRLVPGVAGSATDFEGGGWDKSRLRSLHTRAGELAGAGVLTRFSRRSSGRALPVGGLLCMLLSREPSWGDGAREILTLRGRSQ